MLGFAPPLDQPRAIGSDELSDQSILGRHFAEVRNVIQLPWDKEIDSGFPVECFFQMPTGTISIKLARVWCSQLPFRQDSSVAASGGGSTVTSGGGNNTATSSNPAINTSTDGPHAHNVNGQTLTAHSAHSGGAFSINAYSLSSGNQDTLHIHSGGVTHNHTGAVSNDGSTYSNSGSAESTNHAHAHNATAHTGSFTQPSSHSDHGSHVHDTPSGGTHLHTIPAHSHTVDMTLHTHQVTLSAHTHTLTPGIFETAAVGTLSLFVADDGTNYGTAIISGVSGLNAIVNQDITTQLTIKAGNKRLKFVAGGLGRVQVLLLLDLVVGVPGAG